MCLPRCVELSLFFILQISLLAMLSLCLRSLFKNQRHTASEAIWSEEPKLGSSPRSPRGWPLWSQRDVPLYFISTRKFPLIPNQRFCYITSTYLSYPLEMLRLVSGKQFWCPLKWNLQFPQFFFTVLPLYLSCSNLSFSFWSSPYGLDRALTWRRPSIHTPPFSSFCL